MNKIHRRLGCPCGHNPGEACLTERPMNLRQSCPLPCTSWGWERHAHHAQCPCGEMQRGMREATP